MFVGDRIRIDNKNLAEPITDQHRSPTVTSYGVARIELSHDNDPQRLVLYTVPDQSKSAIGDGKITVEGFIPCFFNEKDIPFEIEYELQNARVSKFKIGSAQTNFRQKDATLTEVRVDPADSKLFQRWMGERFRFTAPKSILAPKLRISYEQIPGTKVWFPVLSIATEMHGRVKLKAYGCSRRVQNDREIRLVQVPKWLVEGEEEGLRTRTWYVGIRNLPYAWGRAIWNQLIDEQARVSGLDMQHASLFAPLLVTKEDDDQKKLGWDLVMEVNEDVGALKSAKSRSLRLNASGPLPSVQITLPLLRSHAGGEIAADLTLAPPDDDLTALRTASKSLDSGIALVAHSAVSLGSGAASAQERRVRVGALDVTFTKAVATDKYAPELRWQLEPEDPEQPTTKYRWERSFIDLVWAVESIAPGGQDDFPGEVYEPGCGDERGGEDDSVTDKKEHDILCSERRERPLVIPLTPSSPPQSLFLRVSERARRGDLRRLGLSLERADGEGGTDTQSGDLTAICAPDDLKDSDSKDPKTSNTPPPPPRDQVVVLDREPFQVAKVSFPALGSLKDQAADNQIATWVNYGHGALAWHISFPDAQAFCLTLPPQAVGETMEKHQTLGEGQTADFRLSPPALLALRERYYRQNFPEAPWNLRRLLADPGRELPGAQVDSLQYELLYGLSCRIDYPFLRLAEMSALIGDVQGPLPQKPRWAPRLINQKVAAGLYDKARAKWASITQRIRQRIGLFELWDIQRLDTLHLKEGVTCWIRHKPLDSTAVVGLPDRLVPVPGADLADPFTKNQDPQGGLLAGGVTWGFESRNVYNAVMHPTPGGIWPQSSGAEISELELSPLGGYGRQMAAFDYWRTKILSDVSMGRTYSYTLERVGRIGVWWNRAKHVIVYERTVVRSRQFGKGVDNTPDQQSHLDGRAVLRKVEEYVEILQHKRKYPDTDHGTERHTGFIKECSFSDDPNQIVRFRVRSSWGTDIGTTGWKVPLWQPGQLPADLYPKPVVHLTVMASVEGESLPRKLTIADPDNLFFYTDTTVPPVSQDDSSLDLSNTDAWLPAEGVDFVDEARPQPSEDPAWAKGLLRQASAGDSALPAGFRPCTFLLDPAEHAVDLLAHREGDPMGAVLSSVTLCRAALGEKARDGVAKQYCDLASQIADTTADWLNGLPNADKMPSGIDLSKVTDLCAQVATGAKALHDELSKTRDQAGPQLENLVDQASQQALAKAKVLLESLLGGADLSELGKSLQKCLDALRKLEANADWKAQLCADIDREVSTLSQRIASLLPSPAVFTDSIVASVRQIRDRLDQMAAQSQEFRAQASASVAQLSTPESILALEAGGQAYLNRLSEGLEKLHRLAETGARIEIKVGGASRSIPFAQGAQKALNLVQKNLMQVEQQLERARDAVGVLRRWHDRLKDMPEETKKLVLSRLQESTSWMDGIGQLRDALDQEIKQLDNIQTEIGTLQHDVIEALRKSLTEVIDPSLNAVPDRLPAKWLEAFEKCKADLATELKMKVDGLKGDARFAQWFKDLPELPDLNQTISPLCENLSQRLQDFIGKFGNEAVAVRHFLEDRRDEILRGLDRTFGDSVREARKVLGQVESTGDDVLKLARAFGKPPAVSDLNFDRPEVAFFYHELENQVKITPVIARAAQAKAVIDALKPFGIDLPVKALGKQLIPAELQNFDLSSILPKIAGMPLDNLFSGLKMPGRSGDHVKVRHGVDVETRRAWVNTEMDFEVPGTTTLFATGPLAVQVEKPLFHAEAHLEADPQGVRQPTMNGRLQGHWRLQIGGFPLITFEDTPLTFDQTGKVDFRVDPKKVKLAPALDFINNLLTSISPGGLTTRFDGDGVVSSLDLPIPDTQLGAFGFSSLRLGASLALRYGGEGFNIGVTAFLARHDAPFTLTIFILGGAGYLELGSRYYPGNGSVATSLNLAIAASASLAIALGPIRGGVAVYVGVTAQYDSKVGGGLVVGLMFMVRGYVSVLSIASATITLRLDAQYQNGSLVGRGFLEISIKICWCFTLEVHESVTYTLGRVGGSQTGMLLDHPQPVAQIASLDGVPRIGGRFGRVGFDPDRLKRCVNDYLEMLA